MFEAVKYQEALRNSPRKKKKKGKQREIVFLKVRSQPHAQTPADSIPLRSSLHSLRQSLNLPELLVKSHVAPNQKTLVEADGRMIFSPGPGGRVSLHRVHRIVLSFRVRLLQHNVSTVWNVSDWKRG